jgi:hypothetical protein
MANKKIIVSSGTGKRQTVPTVSGTESLYIDDATDTLVAKSASLSSLQIGSSGGILSASNGAITVITGASGSILVGNGTTWVAATATNPVGAAGGDLTGSYPSPQVKSIASATSGTLAVANGGTNKTTFTSATILTGSSSGFGSLTNTGGNFSVLKHNGTSWYMDDVSRMKIDISFGGTGTWTKPSGAKKIKVMLLGAGGGGSSGWLRNSTAQNVVGGGGGGSGGFTELFLNVSNLSDGTTIPYYAGLAGSGGQRDVNNGATAGGDGERSAFGVSGSADSPTASNVKFFAQATGGKGGTNTNTAATGGAGGIGNVTNGTSGGSLATFSSTPSAGTSNPKGAAGGGAGGGVSATSAGRDGAAGGNAGELFMVTFAAGGAAGVAASNNNASDGTTPEDASYHTGFIDGNIYFSGGGGGGGAAYGATPQFPGWGSSPNYGGGGGGGGAGYSNGSDGYYCLGGSGGNGFVAIITYF